MIVYRLYAEVESFQGTFADGPNREEVTLAYSEDRAKLETVKREVFGGGNYSVSSSSQYAKMADKWLKRSYTEQDKNPTPNTAVFHTSVGDVTLPLRAYNNFYGDGVMRYVSIDAIEYIKPEDFI